MESNFDDNIIIYDGIGENRFSDYADRIVHILCVRGNMSFSFQRVRFNVVEGDYIILPNPMLASSFSTSGDFQAITMILSESFVTGLAIRSNYGVIGHMALLQNPVMKLSAHDFDICREDMTRIRDRIGDTEHLFREELLGYLLLAHIADLYDIHARQHMGGDISERNAKTLTRFMKMLNDGAYMNHRDVPYYASELCITPHYLTEVCKKASGKPATYWIDRFATHEISRLLRRKDLPLKEISYRMYFSSFSHFSRYTLKQLGIPPSEFRRRHTM